MDFPGARPKNDFPQTTNVNSTEYLSEERLDIYLKHILEILKRVI